MIIVDIETSGLDPLKHGILEIGAIKFENPEIFYQSYSRLDEDDEIDPRALQINGQSEEEAKSFNRPSQKQALIEFFNFITENNDFYIAGENVGSFDFNFIRIRAGKYNLDFPIQNRCFDLQTLAQAKFEQVFGKPLIENGKSILGLSRILKFVGMDDERKEHGALEDCRLEAECISRLRFGKNLIAEYAKFPIPQYLVNKDDNLQ